MGNHLLQNSGILALTNLKRRFLKHGYSRDKRPDCRQVVIAVVLSPEGFPLAHEVMPGNTRSARGSKLRIPSYSRLAPG